MAAIFRPWMNTVMRAVLIVAAVTLVGVPVALMAWVRTPNATRQYQPVAQPIQFDHRIHVAGLRINCEYCHFSAQRSANAGVPATTTCVACHSPLWMGSAMLEPVRRSIATGRPLQWNRVYNLPDFVYFNHAAHVTRGVGCETCHGRVDRMATIYQAVPLTMSWCVDCHRDPASRLRPVTAVTAMGWTASSADSMSSERLAHRFNVRQMTNCTTCHR
jgi:hypothetical protein